MNTPLGLSRHLLTKEKQTSQSKMLFYFRWYNGSVR